MKSNIAYAVLISLHTCHYLYTEIPGQQVPKHGVDLQGKSSCSNFFQRAFKNNTFQCFHVKQQNQMSTFHIIQ